MQSTGRSDISRITYSVATGGFLLPPVIWAVYFVVTYSFQGFACGTGFQHLELFGVSLVRVVLIGLLLVAAGMVAGVGMRAWRHWRRILQTADDSRPEYFDRSVFMSYLSLLLAGIFLIAILWTGIPVLVMDPCLGAFSGS